MMAGRRQRRSAVRPAVVAMLCVLGLMIAGWAVVAEIRRNPGRSVEPTQPASIAPSQPALTRTVSPAVRACTTAVQRGEAAVSRAHRAVADWAAHVQAMTDLLSGKNTPAQTTKIWARTRARGPAGVAGFRAADTDYKRARQQCLGTPAAEVVPEVAATVATCRGVSRQTDAVLVGAGAAVGDWAGHLRAMAEREAGRLDPHHAQQTWLRLYQVARVNIEKFGAAERVYRDHTRCGPPG